MDAGPIDMGDDDRGCGCVVLVGIVGVVLWFIFYGRAA